MLRSFLTAVLLLTIFSSSPSADDSGLKVLFSPQDECGKEILDRLNSAGESIELAMYQLTSRELSNALAQAVRRGVTVRVFLDGENAEEYYSKTDFLKKNGVFVKLEKGEGLMHNKFCVIDTKTVITGSYNWTVSADLKNDENVIIIESDKIANIYRKQFDKYWQGSYPDNAFYTDKNKLKKVFNAKKSDAQ
jgi:phosphatidylserine/phosphatidylglycerophosphate/cardiolipin synthase-like enzyme